MRKSEIWRFSSASAVTSQMVFLKWNQDSLFNSVIYKSKLYNAFILQNNVTSEMGHYMYLIAGKSIKVCNYWGLLFVPLYWGLLMI